MISGCFFFGGWIELLSNRLSVVHPRALARQYKTHDDLDKIPFMTCYSAHFGIAFCMQKFLMSFQKFIIASKYKSVRNQHVCHHFFFLTVIYQLVYLYSLLQEPN